MLTQDEVLAELEARGYEISPRRLVDWRQKALLPPVVKHGQGRGGGWIYVWEDPRIVEQVVTVQELLWIHERTAWLYTPLWCLGFEVPLERVRSQLLARIERRQALLTEGEKDPEELANRLSELALTEVTRPGPRRGRSQESADVLEYWLNVLTGDTDYAPDWEGWGEVATALGSFMGWDAPDGESEDGRRIWSPAGLRLIRRWVRQHAAMPRLEEAAHRASEGEWATVHADWQALARLVRTISDILGEDQWEEYRAFWLRVIAGAGPWLSLVNLSMRLRGQGRVLDGVRQGVSDFAGRLETDPEMDRQVRENWSGTSGV